MRKITEPVLQFWMRCILFAWRPPPGHVSAAMPRCTRIGQSESKIRLHPQSHPSISMFSLAANGPGATDQVCVCLQYVHHIAFWYFKLMIGVYNSLRNAKRHFKKRAKEPVEEKWSLIQNLAQKRFLGWNVRETNPKYVQLCFLTQCFSQT